MHPWRRLRALAEWRLEWHDDGAMGWTDFGAKVISIRRGMTWEQRRCTVLHECLHAERGPVPAGLAAREELRVEKETARLLLPNIKAVADAYVWALGDDDGAATELGVDAGTLRVRMRWCHPAERAYLARRFEEETW